MIRSSEEFWFNGHSSKEFGIINANINSGSMLEEYLFSNRNILEEKIKWNSKPYFNGIEKECKKFDLIFAFSDEVRMNKRALRNVALWLDQSFYSPLWFIEDCRIDPTTMERDITKPQRIYFAILSGESKIHHFGREEGYISLSFKTNSPYCYSDLKGGDKYSIQSDEEGNNFVYFFNHGDKIIKPKISLKNIVDNQKIKIIGKPITDIPEKPLKEFDYTYPIKKTNYDNFPIFEFSEGKKATGSFELLDTVYDGETTTIGEQIYEFDLGDNLPKNKYNKKNILVPVVGEKASNSLIFQNGNVTEASTVTIGDQCFEYDSDDIVTPTNVKVDISKYVAHATGVLHLNTNLIPNQEIKIGDINYTMVGGTNEFIIKMTDHLLTNGQDYNLNVRTDRKTLTQDQVNINTKTMKNINRCLVRNITKNPSDLGIRKMKYLDKDFVMVLWDGESDEDYQEEIDNVEINAKLIINFNEPVDENTINNNTIIVKDIEGKHIDIDFDIDISDGGRTVGVIPKTSYEYNTDYILYVTNGIKDIKGNSYKQIKKIKFHTKKENEINNDYFDNVDVVKNFVLYSGKQINKKTVNSNSIYIIENNSEIKQNIYTFIINKGYGINIVPKIPYKPNTNYTIHITTGVKDIEDNAIVSTEKIIEFHTKENINKTIIETDYDKIITHFPITETITVPFDKKINRIQLLNNSLIKFLDDEGENVDILSETSQEDNKILKISPLGKLKYNSIYYLYISNAIKYEDENNLETPIKYKIITETENESKNNKNVDNEDSKSDKANDYKIVNIDKVFDINLDIPIEENTINDANVYVVNSKGRKVKTNVRLDNTKTAIRVFPAPIWKRDEIYTVYITNEVKARRTPRVYAGDVPPNNNGNKGDYANAKEIFEPLGYEIIRTNNFTIKNGKVFDLNNNEVMFLKNDIILGGDYGLNFEDFNSDGTIKNDIKIVSIPNTFFSKKCIRLRGQDNRTKTKLQMFEYKEKIKNISFTNKSVYKDTTPVLKFATKNKDEHISVEIDTSIMLSNDGLLINEIPKRIKGMRPNDDIWLYEENKLDCAIDNNMLIPNTVPIGAKAYAGKSQTVVLDTADDFHNAKEILEPMGYTIIDTTPMTLEDKKDIPFKEGDLVIGGELAGTMVYDFDANGNLKSTPPQRDNPKDTRKTRITGVPRDVTLPPIVRRLCGDASNPGRIGTKKAMEDWANLLKQSKSSKPTLPEGYTSNFALNGITVKYKVPDDAIIYGTGTDFFNSLRYLGSMGYEFINVGNMSLEEKIALPFKKGDIVVGGTGASDIVINNGTNQKVTGIPAIDIKEATRLGGKNRLETEKKIKDFAFSLKVKSINVGDIVKLKIKIADENLYTTNNINDGETPTLTHNSKIKKNIRTEYHIVKNIKELSRNRLFIEFQENIRTIHYIESIQIEKVYKKYEERKAEDYLFTAPYQIKIGYNKNETMINIIKAINNTGTMGREYSLRTFKHPIVLAYKENENEIKLYAIKAGEKGNIPVSLVDKLDPLNRFLTPTLVGGKDCTQDNAVIALAKTIEEQNKLPERYNKDKYTCEYTSNTLTITHILYGEKFNNIVCLVNITKEEVTPYVIQEGNYNLINLQDFLTRKKQIAKWENPTLIGGKNPLISECIVALKNKIEKHQDEKINVDFYINKDASINKNKLQFEYKEIGEEGNISLDTTCMNGKISGKKFSGGLDGLKEGEELYINCEKQEIISSLNKDRYKNFNGNWLHIPLDGVKLEIKEGKCEIAFRYREIYNI